jgi:hypothetical protein
MQSAAMSIERKCSGRTHRDGAPATMTGLRESSVWREPCADPRNSQNRKRPISVSTLSVAPC